MSYDPPTRKYSRDEIKRLIEEIPAEVSLYHARESKDLHAMLVHVAQFPSEGTRIFCERLDSLKHFRREDLETRLD